MRINVELLKVSQEWVPPSTYRNVVVLGLLGREIVLEVGDDELALLIRAAQGDPDDSPRLKGEPVSPAGPLELREDMDPPQQWVPHDPLEALRARARTPVTAEAPRLPPRPAPLQAPEPVPMSGADDDPFEQG